MPSIRLLPVLSIALFSVFWITGTVHPGSRNVVRPMSVGQFDQMVNAQNSQYVIVFMAAWCTPCIEELPAIQTLFRKYKARGLHLVGASLDIGGPQAIQQLVDEYRVRFPVYWVGEKAIEWFGIKGIPLILFVQDGVVIKHVEGKRNPKDLENLIKDFLESAQH